MMSNKRFTWRQLVIQCSNRNIGMYYDIILIEIILYCKKIIDLIGEPVLRIKLDEMLNNCMGKDTEILRLKQEISEKEERIKQIEERRKKNDSN